MADDRPHKAIARLRNRKFADSPLEGSGFELSVPRQIANGFEALSETGPIGYRRRGLIRAVAGFAEYPD
jgi:hypothetical protein